MTNEEQPFRITEEDKKKYDRLIAEFDLSVKDEILEQIPDKLAKMLGERHLSRYQQELIEDISRLYAVLKNVPDLEEAVQKRILFALKYFNDPDDDIPDDTPVIGYLDDAVLVHWIAEQTLAEYAHIFEA